MKKLNVNALRDNPPAYVISYPTSVGVKIYPLMNIFKD